MSDKFIGQVEWDKLSKDDRCDWMTMAIEGKLPKQRPRMPSDVLSHSSMTSWNAPIVIQRKCTCGANEGLRGCEYCS